MRIFELLPVNDSRKSFYGKARVIENDDYIWLLSYDTIVAVLQDGRMELKGWFSATTARHIKEFAQFYGFAAPTKKQMEDKQTLTK